MKKKQNYVLVLLLLSLCCSATARQINYSYDSAGNRIRQYREMSVRPIQPTMTSEGDPTDGCNAFSVEQSQGTTIIRIKDFSKENLYTVAFYNLHGKLLLRQSVHDQIVEIDTRTFSHGDYIIQLNTNGEMKSWKYNIQ